MLRWNLTGAREAIRLNAARRLEAAARAGLDEALRLVPRDTGFLASTLGYTINTANLVVKLHADARYALPVEMGHRTRNGGYVAARPYIRPALDAAAAVLLEGRSAVGSFPNAPGGFGPWA